MSAPGTTSHAPGRQPVRQLIEETVIKLKVEHLPRN
jgi:hypothetical protein